MYPAVNAVGVGQALPWQEDAVSSIPTWIPASAGMTGKLCRVGCAHQKRGVGNWNLLPGEPGVSPGFFKVPQRLGDLGGSESDFAPN